MSIIPRQKKKNKQKKELSTLDYFLNDVKDHKEMQSEQKKIKRENLFYIMLIGIVKIK